MTGTKSSTKELTICTIGGLGSFQEGVGDHGVRQAAQEQPSVTGRGNELQNDGGARPSYGAAT